MVSRSPFLEILPAHRYDELDDAKAAFVRLGETLRQKPLPESLQPFVQPDGTVGIEPDPRLPAHLVLYPCQPNPLRDQAVIRFDLRYTNRSSAFRLRMTG